MKNNFQSSLWCMELTHDFYYLSARVCIKMTVGYINTNFMTVERCLFMCHFMYMYIFNTVLQLSPASIESKVKTYSFKVAFKTL